MITRDDTGTIFHVQLYATAGVEYASERRRSHVSIMGVTKVVTITMITITEKTSSDTTPSDFPIAAKISPTSPRGIMPTPTIHLFTFPAATPDTILPKTATAVTPRATSSTFGLSSVSSSTPI